MHIISSGFIYFFTRQFCSGAVKRKLEKLEYRKLGGRQLCAEFYQIQQCYAVGEQYC